MNLIIIWASLLIAGASVTYWLMGRELYRRVWALKTLPRCLVRNIYVRHKNHQALMFFLVGSALLAMGTTLLYIEWSAS